MVLLLVPLGLTTGQEQKPAASPALRGWQENAALDAFSQSWTPPPFRRLLVVALDRRGEAATGLTEGDLRVTDNGEPRDIASLLPNDNRPAAPAPLGPREYSNQTGFRRGSTVILFDLLNGALANREYMAGTILSSLEHAEDPASIYLYILSNKGTLYPVRGLLADQPGGAPPDTDWTKHAKTLIGDAIRHVYGLRGKDEESLAYREILTYRALHGLAAAAALLPGPMSIIWTTHGFPLQVGIAAGQYRAVTVEGVAVPCSHLGGGDYLDFTAVSRRLAERMAKAGISIWPVDESELDQRVMARAMEDAFSGMTGGKTYDCCGQTPAAVAMALAATRFNYTLTYSAAAQNWDGQFHRVKVTCLRKDVQIQTEDGYNADEPMDQTASLVQVAARGPSDIPAISLRAAASRGTALDTVRFEVRIGLPDLFILPRGDRFTGDLALVFVGLGDKGPALLTGVPSFLTLSLSAADWNAARDVTVTKELAVPESIHQVRIIVVDRWSGRAGSLTVPKSW
jgi:VWFA-related protein